MAGEVERERPWCGLCGHEIIRKLESPADDGPEWEWEHVPFPPAGYDHWAAPVGWYEIASANPLRPEESASTEVSNARFKRACG